MSGFSSRGVQAVLYGVAGLVAIAIVARFVAKGMDAIDDTTLNYAVVAAALVLMREVKTFAFGDLKVEFERKLDELKTRVDDTQAGALKGKTKPQAATRSLDGARDSSGPQPGSVPDDPWAGVFGRSASNRNRVLEAEVSDVGSDLFRVRLRVRSTDQAKFPLNGSVQYFLHHTFANDRPIVTASASGVAELVVTAWGAFTVGAAADDGQTRLELDLAQQPSAPMRFRER